LFSAVRLHASFGHHNGMLHLVSALPLLKASESRIIGHHVTLFESKTSPRALREDETWRRAGLSAFCGFPAREILSSSPEYLTARATRYRSRLRRSKKGVGCRPLGPSQPPSAGLRRSAKSGAPRQPACPRKSRSHARYSSRRHTPDPCQNHLGLTLIAGPIIGLTSPETASLSLDSVDAESKFVHNGVHFDAP